MSACFIRGQPFDFCGGGGGGVWVISEKISYRPISNEKKIDSPPPPKVKWSAPKAASYLHWWSPEGVHTKNLARTWAIVIRFLTFPSHAEVKCLLHYERSSRQEGGSKCCRWRYHVERSSCTRSIELFALI